MSAAAAPDIYQRTRGHEFIESLQSGLSHQHVTVDPRHSDTVVYGILQWLNFPYAPDSFYLSHPIQEDDSFLIVMKTPFNCPRETFIETLHACIHAKNLTSNIISTYCHTGPAFDISIRFLYSNLSDTDFLELRACYQSQFTSKDRPYLRDYYQQPFQHRRIQMNKIDECLHGFLTRKHKYDFFFLTKDDLWNNLAQLLDPEKRSLKVIEKRIGNTFDTFNVIDLLCELTTTTTTPTSTTIYDTDNNNPIICIRTSRCQIKNILAGISPLGGDFKCLLTRNMEKMPFGEYTLSKPLIRFMNRYGSIYQFRKENVDDDPQQQINEEGLLFSIRCYFLAIGRCYEYFDMLNIKGNKTGAIYYDGQPLFYETDETNFAEVLLALRELNGLTCYQERLCQLKSYIEQSQWTKLRDRLSLLLNLDTIFFDQNVQENTKLFYCYNGVRIYIYFGQKLINYAKDIAATEPEKANTLLHIIYDVYSSIQKKHPRDVVEVNRVLHNVINMSCFDGKPKDLLEKLFIYSYRGKLPECRQYATQLCGFNLDSDSDSDGSDGSNSNNDDFDTTMTNDKQEKMFFKLCKQYSCMMQQEVS